MRPKGSAKELEVRRWIAARLLTQGKGVREVARLVDASPSSVERWKQALQRAGPDGLKAKSHPGRRPRLSARQKQQLQKHQLQKQNQQRIQRKRRNFIKKIIFPIVTYMVLWGSLVAFDVWDVTTPVQIRAAPYSKERIWTQANTNV